VNHGDRLHAPPNVSCESALGTDLYNLEPEAPLRNAAHRRVNSLDKAVPKNADGSVEIDVGAQTPAGMGANRTCNPKPRTGAARP
jgi:hypothetical protein